MARYQIDASLINLPSGTTSIDSYLTTSWGGFGPMDLAISGTDISGSVDAEPDEQVWITINAMASVDNGGVMETQTLAYVVAGPYLISEVGVVVP